jgi:hypothetical protein
MDREITDPNEFIGEGYKFVGHINKRNFEAGLRRILKEGRFEGAERIACVCSNPLLAKYNLPSPKSVYFVYIKYDRNQRKKIEEREAAGEDLTPLQALRNYRIKLMGGRETTRFINFWNLKALHPVE